MRLIFGDDFWHGLRHGLFVLLKRAVMTEVTLGFPLLNFQIKPVFLTGSENPFITKFTPNIKFDVGSIAVHTQTIFWVQQFNNPFMCHPMPHSP